MPVSQGKTDFPDVKHLSQNDFGALKARPPFLAKVAPGALVLEQAWHEFDWLLNAHEDSAPSLPSVIKEATGAAIAFELFTGSAHCTD